MAEIALEHRFEPAPGKLWELIWDPSLLGWMCQHLSTIERREVLEEKILQDGRTRRVVKTVPKDRIPAVARGVLTTDMLAWEEEQLFHRAFQKEDPRIDFTITTSSLRLRSFFECKGAYLLEPQGAGTRRTIRATLAVRAGPLVRRLAEKYLLEEVTRGIDEEARQLALFAKAKEGLRGDAPS